MNNQTKAEQVDLRMTRNAVMVHPEIDGVIRIEFYANSYKGVARYKGKMFECSLRLLLEQGWIHFNRPSFKSAGR